ncbi:hypothetical protein ACFCV8_18800 [Streptomyces sp. NPDC056347]|uniref:hypothetical protein n=1 Tax=Streptomyces sp. NPDC056347 TaxID=3345790 RepID=UPI0035DF4F9A
MTSPSPWAFCTDFRPAARSVAVASPEARRVPSPSKNSTETMYDARPSDPFTISTSASGHSVSESTRHPVIRTSPRASAPPSDGGSAGAAEPSPAGVARASSGLNPPEDEPLLLSTAINTPDGQQRDHPADRGQRDDQPGTRLPRRLRVAVRHVSPLEQH